MTSKLSKVPDECVRGIRTGETVEACLADCPDVQAETGAQQEKAQVLEDARRQAAEINGRVMETCRASIDAVHSVILEAIKDSCERAKETTASVLAMMEEEAKTEVAAYLSPSSLDVKQSGEEAPDLKAGDSEVVTSEGKGETQSHSKSGLDLTGLYEASAKLRESEALLKATLMAEPAGAEGGELADAETAPKSGVENASQGEVEGVPQSEVEQEPASQEGDSQDDEEQEPSAIKTGPESDEEKRPDATAGGEPGEEDAGLYRGNVTVVFPERTRAFWMLQLRQLILETPGVQILGESYADKDGARLKLSLSEPLALPDMLRELPDVRKVTDRSNGGTRKHKGLRWPSGSHEQQQILVMALDGNAIQGETAPPPSAS